MKTIDFPKFRIFYGGILLPDAAHFLAAAYAVVSSNSNDCKHDDIYEWLFKFTACSGRTRTSEAKMATEVVCKFVDLLNDNEAELISKWSDEYWPKAADWLVLSTRECLHRMMAANPESGTISWEGLEIENRSQPDGFAD